MRDIGVDSVMVVSKRNLGNRYKYIKLETYINCRKVNGKVKMLKLVLVIVIRMEYQLDLALIIVLIILRI